MARESIMPNGSYGIRLGNNASVFDRLWLDPAYVALHRAKDAVKPFNTPPNTPERTAALAAFDAACEAIEAYERAAGVV
jgi:hypothetical protein